MERHEIKEPERSQLLKQLRAVTKLPLPYKDLYLGNVQFFLRNHDNKNDYDFQIRWGSKNILIERNVTSAAAEVSKEEIQRLMQVHAGSMRKKLIEYCVEQLNNIVTIELPIQLQKRLPSFVNYNLFVNICRIQKKETNNNWPAISVFISWDDELGEFQEFVYPLKFDNETDHFILDYEDIVNNLVRYRDSL